MNHTNKTMTIHRRRVKADASDQIEPILAEHFQRGQQNALQAVLHGAYSCCQRQSDFKNFAWFVLCAADDGASLDAALERAQLRFDRRAA